jgi:hypothetical protein
MEVITSKNFVIGVIVGVALVYAWTMIVPRARMGKGDG